MALVASHPVKEGAKIGMFLPAQFAKAFAESIDKMADTVSLSTESRQRVYLYLYLLR